ncbi:Alpha/beta hydrolase family-domain-containing protein [Aspergillus undulatus]|uniref:Alpha/beta hydrolase family-domain-containing protein n=1 Tax=Aspergillus undulatus TaxID=1810928 RepID=UPI003CCDEC0A
MSHFRIIEHTIRCQNIRERLGAVKPGHENDLRLAVKQYIPKDNTTSRYGNITIIGAHANAFPKQGQSGILNESIYGNDLDNTSRDLLSLVNYFSSQITLTSPIVGIGQSMGGMQLARLSLLHPSLFSALILLDPVIQRVNPGLIFAAASTSRSDLWASQPVYQAWDERVFEKWTQYGLREMPTALYPLCEKDHWGKGNVTLTTAKARELFIYVRPSYIDCQSGIVRGSPEEDMDSDVIAIHNTDINTDTDSVPFYRPEPARMFRRLPEVKPLVLYLFGSKSDLSSPNTRREEIESTGTGVGGSGGLVKGQVEEIVLPAGHMVPVEMVWESGQARADFIARRVKGWEWNVKRFRDAWEGVDWQEQVRVDEQLRDSIGY